MKNLVSALLIVIFSLTFVSAQTDDKIEWETFSPIREEFSVEVSKLPVLARFSGKDEESARLYKSFSNGTYLFITSDKNIKSSHYKLLSLLAEENKAKSVDKFVGSFSGQRFSFTDSEGFHQEILAVKAKKRFYIFHTVSEKTDNPVVERFFASVTLDKTLPVNPATETEKVENTDEANPFEENKFQVQAVSEASRAEAGAGTGNGIGNRTQTGDNPASSNIAKSTTITRAVNLLSKPRATYTELARIYEVSGNVMVRVTFLASGEIGSITPITKQPFGLTKSAISAAGQIRFEPAMRDGKAFNVTKQIQYSFVLY